MGIEIPFSAYIVLTPWKRAGLGLWVFVLWPLPVGAPVWFFFFSYHVLIKILIWGFMVSLLLYESYCNYRWRSLSGEHCVVPEGRVSQLKFWHSLLVPRQEKAFLRRWSLKAFHYSFLSDRTVKRWGTKGLFCLLILICVLKTDNLVDFFYSGLGFFFCFNIQPLLLYLLGFFAFFLIFL